MCAVSAIYNYGMNIPYESWKSEEFRQHFKKLLQEAIDFDNNTGQRDCEDPEKAKWWNAIEEVKEPK